KKNCNFCGGVRGLPTAGISDIA
ncbi:unnamed protein product, partial [Allacma fusca]